ncbi:MAG: hypothetical protein HC831_08885 [Chloroflexia bacterium]|nr:hypothetical protein [Chloroflexia bacterium]
MKTFLKHFTQQSLIIMVLFILQFHIAVLGQETDKKENSAAAIIEQTIDKKGLESAIKQFESIKSDSENTI